MGIPGLVIKLELIALLHEMQNAECRIGDASSFPTTVSLRAPQGRGNLLVQCINNHCTKGDH